MDKSLTEEQLTTLTRLESYLQTAVNANYIRALPMQDAIALNEIHISLFKRKQNLRCPKCVLEMCKNLGKVYYIDKKEEDGKKRQS